MAFYDFGTKINLDLGEIVKKNIAFRIPVTNHSIKSGEWKILGNLPLSEEIKIAPIFFREDAISGEYSLYRDDVETPCLKEECIGLERAAVWDPEHIEDRLRDHYAGVPNRWVIEQQLK